MVRSRAEFFRAGVAECYAAAQAVHDCAIKQAYLELAQGWQALAEEIERLRTQIWRPQIYSGPGLPKRSLDDFYELRTAEPSRRAAKHAIEHPALGDRRQNTPQDAAQDTAIGDERSSPRPRRGQMR